MRKKSSLLATLSLASSVLLAGAVTLAPAHAQDMRLAGSWKLNKPLITPLRTTDNAPPPYTAQGASILKQRLDEQAKGKSSDGVETRCLPPGNPRLMTTDRPFTILITPQKVTLLHEFQHTIRHVYLNEELPSEDDVDPFFGGTSVGHWEGDTLVIKTARFNDQIQLDASGTPQSENSQITERYRVINNGQTLENTILVEDPDNYTAPWTTRIEYDKSDVVHLAEDICAYKLLDQALRDRVDAK